MLDFSATDICPYYLIDTLSSNRHFSEQHETSLLVKRDIPTVETVNRNLPDISRIRIPKLHTKTASKTEYIVTHPGSSHQFI